jgi:uncharacterized hydrophobic protein (TIGR00271 family)
MNDAEFQDYEGDLFPGVSGYDLSRLWSQASLRGLAAIIISIVLISAPSRSPRLLSVLIAVVLIAWSVGGTLDLVRGERSLITTMRLILLVGIAVTLIVWPRFSAADLGRMVGVALVVSGVVSGYGAFRRRKQKSLVLDGVGGLLYVALGLALAAAPDTLLQIALLGLSLYWFTAGVLTVIATIKTDAVDIRPGETWRTFLKWVESRPNTADDRSELYAKIFYEGAEGPRRLSRFFTLMAFATTIAFFGVASDSTAVVIGAMLIAPLMTPLMGTSLGMIMGWPRRATITGLVALSGIALAVGLSILYGWALAADISPVLNSEVASRVAPTLVDLIIAIAAGGAGAFAMSRPDVSDSLPGVAVAIALVPPLAVVGLMISQNDWDQAAGALLLFTTNLVAILLVGGLVFVMTGVVPLFQISRNKKRIRLAVGMASVLAIAVIAVLGVNAQQFQAQISGTNTATGVVDEWLTGTEMSVTSIDVDRDQVVVGLEGPQEPPPVSDLSSALEQELGRPVDVSVTWIQKTFYDIPATE